MSLSQSRANSAATNGAYHLRAAVEVREIAEQRSDYDRRKAAGLYAAVPNWEVIGECGHRLTVVAERDVDIWLRRIDTETRHRKRCDSCPREASAR